jgi:hypothetical protein
MSHQTWTREPLTPDIGRPFTDVPKHPIFLQNKVFALGRISVDKLKWWSKWWSNS